MDTKQRERRLKVWRDWYANNSESYNAERRAAYGNDSERQEYANAYSVTFRSKIKAGHLPAPPPIYKTIHGNTVRLYRLSEAARSIDCSPQTIRNWQHEKWIPEPLFDGRRQLFTKHQIALLRRMYPKPTKLSTDKRKQISKDIFAAWKIP